MSEKEYPRPEDMERAADMVDAVFYDAKDGQVQEDVDTFWARVAESEEGRTPTMSPEANQITLIA